MYESDQTAAFQPLTQFQEQAQAEIYANMTQQTLSFAPKPVPAPEHKVPHTHRQPPIPTAPQPEPQPVEESHKFNELSRDLQVPYQVMAENADPPDMFQQPIDHRRSAHLSDDKVNARLRLDGKKPMGSTSRDKCAICRLAKMRTAAVSRGSQEHPTRPACYCSLCTSSRAKARRYTTQPGQSVSIDLTGPFKTPTIGGNKYAFVVVDHFTRYVWVDFMPSKSSRCTHNSFLRYCAHTQKCPDHVHTDGGKEFMGSFAQHLRDKMVYQTFTCPYRSFQNSIVERRMLSLKQATRALMLESGLPEPFYGSAMHTASVILNLHPTFGDPVHHVTERLVP